MSAKKTVSDKKSISRRAKLLRSLLAVLLACGLFPLLAYATPGPAQAPSPASAEATGATDASASATTPQAGTTPSSGAAAPVSTSSSTSASTPATVSAKDEVIYVTLGGDGSVQNGYVVNHFDVSTAGELIDHGTYREAQNLSTTLPLAQSGGVVRTPVTAGDFYYQGTLAQTTLPWDIAVSYTLDGKAITASELAGKSGHLELRIATRANRQVLPLYFENYVLQIQLTLGTEKARGLVAPDASIAQSGASRQVVFTVLPGKEAELSLEAEVTDFEMDRIQIAALPFSMAFDLPDTSELSDGLSQLTDAIALIHEGVGALDAGVADMSAGGARVAAGSQQFSDGLTLLGLGSQQLRDGSATFNGTFALLATRLRSAYDQLDAGLASVGIDLSQINADLISLGQILTDLDNLAALIASSAASIDAAIADINAFVASFTPIDAATLAQLQAEVAGISDSDLSPASKATIATLISDYQLAQNLVDNWVNLRPALEGLSALLSSIDAASLQQFTQRLRDALASLSGALGDIGSLEDVVIAVEQLAVGYSSFDAGLRSYTQGVDGLAAGFPGFNEGLQSYMDGVDKLHGGTSGLHAGTGQLVANTSDLPAKVREQLDAFMASYDFSDFKPRSFVSPENTQVELVQFVLFTEPIKVVPPPEPPVEPVKPQSFWDRLLALFGL